VNKKRGPYTSNDLMRIEPGDSITNVLHLSKGWIFTAGIDYQIVYWVGNLVFPNDGLAKSKPLVFKPN